MSCIQSSVALLFNEKNQYQYKEIREILGIPDSTLKNSLMPIMFSKLRFLINRGPEGKGSYFSIITVREKKTKWKKTWCFPIK